MSNKMNGPEVNESGPDEDEDYTGSEPDDEGDEDYSGSGSDEGDNGTNDFLISEAISFRGYEKAAPFGKPCAIIPAPPPPALPTGQGPPVTYKKIENIGKEECQEAFMNFAASNRYGKETAKQHEVKAVKPLTYHQYVLQTHCEERRIGYSHAPFKGEYIDGQENGAPSLPWDVECQPDQPFESQMKILEVPHTAYVKTCHGCDGQGKWMCKPCGGRGAKKCGQCKGKGKWRVQNKQKNWRTKTCFYCNGNGTKICGTCFKRGEVSCKACDGSGQLKCYIELEVTFMNHVESYIYEPTDLSGDLIRKGKGEIIFEQKLLQVWPVKDFPVPDIAQHSVKMLEKHRTNWPDERRLQQKQHIRSFPVTEVDAVWKDWSSRYWVYGLDKQVYCPDYPQRGCTCTIL